MSEGHYFPAESRVDSTEKMLSEIMSEQYISKNMDSILEHTDLDRHEIMDLCSTLMGQYINEILSVDKEDLEGTVSVEERSYLLNKLRMRKMLLRNPNFMVHTIINTYWRFFGMLRISLNRQSRMEGLKVSTAGVQRNMEQGGIGIGDRLLSRVGLGKYRRETMYSEK